MTHHNSNTQNSFSTVPQGPALPTDRSDALRSLIKMTQALIAFAEREAQALAKNDMLNFAIMQDEKSVLTERYVQMSQEFRSRLIDFRGADPGLLDQLDRLQQDLAESSRDNNGVIDCIQMRARSNTCNTLFSAQEIGQTHNVNFANDINHTTDKNHN